MFLGDIGTSGVVFILGDSCFFKVMRIWFGLCGVRVYLGCKWTRVMWERGFSILVRLLAGGSEELYERSCGCFYLILVSFCCVFVVFVRVRRGGFFVRVVLVLRC